MCPKNNKDLESYLMDWMGVKNGVFGGDAGLQLSINSTSDSERDIMFSWNALELGKIEEIGRKLPHPMGRKITLNFAVSGYEIDAKRLRRLFDPAKFIVKLTPIHKTTTALEHGIETEGDYTCMYPYLHHEKELRKRI